MPRRVFERYCVGNDDGEEPQVDVSAHLRMLSEERKKDDSNRRRTWEEERELLQSRTQGGQRSNQPQPRPVGVSGTRNAPVMVDGVCIEDFPGLVAGTYPGYQHTRSRATHNQGAGSAGSRGGTDR